MKKVLLILIDALTARLLQPAIERGEYPNLGALCENGRFQESISIFPSITHAALSSFATGTYPKQHGIPGTYFYLRETDELGYFGSDFSVVLRDGLSEVFYNFTRNLNHRWLKRTTLYEHAEEMGHITSCFNCLIFRGSHTHPLDPPLLLKLIPNIDSSELSVQGPTNLFLGDMVNDTPVAKGGTPRLKNGATNWYGFKDGSSQEVLLQMARQDAFTDLTVVYFAENDFISHDEGPEAAHNQLSTFDDWLGQLANIYGGIDGLLSNFAIILTGDHSQSDVKENGAVNLESVLSDFKIVPSGKTWGKNDDILVAPNLRSATIYIGEEKRSLLRDVVKVLIQEPKVDQIIAKAKLFSEEAKGYVILSQRGNLRFWSGKRAIDHYGNGWDWDGSLEAVDAEYKNGRLHFDTYPNAFERIDGIVGSEQSGDIWITAELGYEFCLPSIETHVDGGSHGSLHRLDSISPLITAGLPEGVLPPEHPRLVDITPLCLDTLAAVSKTYQAPFVNAL